MVLIIIGIILIFSFLVIAHELGHFLAARRAGIKVDEFGVGFPPRIASITRGGTRYSLNLFPIGGFVRLHGEDGLSHSKDSFAAKTFWQKTGVVMAGVAVNFAIAYLIFTFLLATSMPPLLQGLPEFGPIKPQVVGSSELSIFSVGSNSAAEQAGVKLGDTLVAINGQNFTSNEQLKEYTRSHAGQSVSIEYKRGSDVLSKATTLGTDENSGILGIVVQPMQGMRYAWWAAPIAAFVLMCQLIWLTLAAFGELIVGLFTRAQVSEQVAGPIGVVSIFAQIVNFGPAFILVFIASISLSLAVINALPLPALDGGRQLMMILQKLGVKITPQREQLIHVAGFVGLIALMIIVSISDIARMR